MGHHEQSPQGTDAGARPKGLAASSCTAVNYGSSTHRAGNQHHLGHRGNYLGAELRSLGQEAGGGSHTDALSSSKGKGFGFGGEVGMRPWRPPIPAPRPPHQAPHGWGSWLHCMHCSPSRKSLSCGKTQEQVPATQAGGGWAGLAALLPCSAPRPAAGLLHSQLRPLPVTDEDCSSSCSLLECSAASSLCRAPPTRLAGPARSTLDATA